jgi:Cu(I)/Ag(I) efflux system membrane fusion protein
VSSAPAPSPTRRAARGTLLVALLLLTFLVGRASVHVPVAGEAAVATAFTCPMHPAVVLPEASGCPLCGMDLVPRDGAAELGPTAVRLSPAEQALAGVATATVERRPVTSELRFRGQLAVDEAARRSFASTLSGRIEVLHAARPGQRVRAGEVLYELSSPALIGAEEQLLLARARLEAEARAGGTFRNENLERGYTDARNTLRLWGLDEAQIAAVEARGQASDRLEFRAARDAVVLERHVDPGSYLMMGMPVLQLQELDRLWLEFEATQEELALLHYGQPVRAELDGPGHLRLGGRIGFREPWLDGATRTATVRVSLDNLAGELAPGALARVTVAVELDSAGGARAPELSGTWVSPAFPELFFDAPGRCPRTGQELVPAQGAPRAGPGGDPLVVPAGAVLWSGVRSLVYVQDLAAEEPTYRAREVELGPRAGPWQVLVSGVEVGEQVVTAGAFRLDASLQIRGGEGMLSRPESAAGEPPGAELLRAAGGPLFEAYLALGEALAADQLGAAQAAVERLPAALAALAESVTAGGAAYLAADLGSAQQDLAGAKDLEALRRAFEPLSQVLHTFARRYGVAGAQTLQLVHCPMAFDDRGARWLQPLGAVANPYFGASMLRCGRSEAEFRSR